ncbi:MAG: hypothetical protein AAGH45_01100 [Pseudomonadota bacterium]
MDFRLGKRTAMGLAGAMALALGACASETLWGEAPPSAPPVAEGAQSERDLPAGSIEIQEDVYAVPIGKRQGCTQFRLWSNTKMVAQAIYYLDQNGQLTFLADECAY